MLIKDDKKIPYPLLFVVRFMTTVQSSLGWCKPTLRFIVEIQGVDPRIIST